MQDKENVLAGILKLVRSRRGIGHLAAGKALKTYLDRIPDAQFKRDVEGIADESLFGYLLASGLSMDRQRILAERKVGG